MFYIPCMRPLRFRIVFKNLKNQSAFYSHHASQMNIKQFEILFKTWSTKVKNQKTRVLLKWIKND